MQFLCISQRHTNRGHVFFLYVLLVKESICGTNYTITVLWKLQGLLQLTLIVLWPTYFRIRVR